MKFVKLHSADNGEPGWFSARHIVMLGLTKNGTLVAIHGADSAELVRESPEEILALLAEPPSVEVTEAVVNVALDVWNGGAWWRTTELEDRLIPQMRAAIEAADRARGLRA